MTAPVSLDDIAAQLRAWRVEAGSPTFSRIAARVADVRAERGMHPREQAPGRVTVYDCFKDGRRRLDVELAVDIARVLGVPEARLTTFRVECFDIQSAPTAMIAASSDLPPRVEPFIGRSTELTTILRAGAPLLITGMAGVGKTSLAAEAMWALLDEDAISRVVFLSARTASHPTAVLEAIGRAVGLQADAANDIARELADLRVGVLVDDLADAGQIAPLLAERPTTPVIVTSRRDLSAAFGESLLVVPWDSADTLSMFRATLGGDRVAAEPEAAAELAARVEGLPLAVVLTAARIREKASWSLDDHLRALTARLDDLRLEDPVVQSISVSYAALSAAAQTALRMLAAQPCTELPRTWVGALCGTDEQQTEAVLRELREAHFLTLDGAGMLRSHALIRAYGRARSWDDDPPSAREVGIRSMADTALAEMWAAIEVLQPGTLWRRRVERPDAPTYDGTEAAQFFGRSLTALTELAAECAELAPEVTVEVAAALGRHLDNVGLYRVAQPLHEQAAAAAKSIGDVVGEACAELDVGQTGVRLGLPGASRQLEWASELAVRADVPRVVMAAANALGILAAQRGDAHTALRQFEEGLATAREHGYVELIGPLTDNIAIMYRQLGDFEGALAHHLAAHADAVRRGERANESSALANASEVYLLLGRTDEAIASARRARGIAQEFGIHISDAYAASNLGMALAASGDVEAALDHYAEALDAARRLGAGSLEASVLNNIGEAQPDLEAAREAFTAARDLADRLGLAVERERAVDGLRRRGASHVA